ncbi:hypothetical protein TIFTF001_007369 [Ficus carica]|uniref:Uncharacterized protein n=1 Tax=Ficus carica TaxID=3494 RepID=A0AA87ZQ01_FICCA|nr:hypothetical protein TIFTF001_007369 [Ficus carica]
MREPEGGKAIPGPGATTASGLGGLGMEGMVGREDSAGERGSFLGEGNRGVMSGERAGDSEESGGPGKTAGAAEMVENWMPGFGVESAANEEWVMKAMKIAESNGLKREAINDEK